MVYLGHTVDETCFIWDTLYIKHVFMDTLYINYKT